MRLVVMRVMAAKYFKNKEVERIDDETEKNEGEAQNGGEEMGKIVRR